MIDHELLQLDTARLATNNSHYGFGRLERAGGVGRLRRVLIALLEHTADKEKGKDDEQNQEQNQAIFAPMAAEFQYKQGLDVLCAPFVIVVAAQEKEALVV